METEYCYNCDTEAVAYVDWRLPNGEIKRTYMCRPCKDAFEFGQSIPHNEAQELD